MDGRAPDYRIIIDGQDVTPIIKSNLIKISVVDQVGIESDRAEIQIADPGRGFELPRQGAEMSIALGYEGLPLVPQGVFILNEIPFEGPNRSLTIKAHAADMRKLLKETKTRSFDDITAQDLVGQIASEHNLQGVIGADLASYAWEHIDQREESDMHLLTRLGRDLDAVSKPTNQRWVFVPRGQQKAASGIALQPVSITPSNITSWSGNLKERPRYNSIVAQYQDLDAGELKEVIVGSGGPVKRLSQIYVNQEEAEAAANGRFKRLQRSKGTMTIIMPGLPDVFAESPLDVSGIKPGIDGRWVAATVTQAITKGAKGFGTNIRAELPS